MQTRSWLPLAGAKAIESIWLRTAGLKMTESKWLRAAGLELAKLRWLGLAAAWAVILPTISPALVTATPNSNGCTAPVAAKKRLKIVSLAPSNTELLCSVGARNEITGVCTFCDYPADLQSVDKVGTFVSANIERLARLKPDLILLVSGQEQLADKLKRHHFRTIILDNSNLSDISANLKQLGKLSGHEADGEKAAQSFEEKLAAMTRIIRRSSEEPRVFYCVWPHPLMTVGKKSFLNQLITTCGGTNVAGDLNVAYPTFSLERLVLSNPDVIILPFEARGQNFIGQPPWNKLKAVQEKHVYYLPDARNDMLSRPTMRVLKGIQWLAGVLHPELGTQLRDCRLSQAPRSGLIL